MKICRGISIAFMILSLTLSGALSGSSHPAQEYVEGEVIVTFKPSVSLNDAQQALGRHSLALTKHYAELSRHRGRHTGLVRATNRTTAELIAELNQDPAVELAEPNYLRWVTGTPNDTLFTNLWGLQNTGQSVDGFAGTAGDDIHFVAAWGGHGQPRINSLSPSLTRGWITRIRTWRQHVDQFLRNSRQWQG